MVDLATWCDVVSRHPFKYKYDGLSRPGKTVRDAVRQDERVCSRLYEDWQYEQWKSYSDPADESGMYAEYVAQREADGEIPLEQSAWANEQIQLECEISDEEYWLPDEESLLKDYPPEGVWEHAGEYAVAFDKVLVICPGCGHNPVDVDWGAGGGGPTKHGFYCGLCGAQMSWEDEEDMYETMLDVGIVPWPYDLEKRTAFYKHCQATDRPPFYAEDRREYEVWLAKQVMETIP